jgi:hypothetical protein
MIHRVRAGTAAALLASIVLAGCGKSGDETGNAASANKVTVIQGGNAIASGQVSGTPMAERVAVVGVLNKRNGLTRDLNMKPGEALRWGTAIVRLRACEQTAPWENPPETGAFVQLDVQETRDNKWHRIFSGWLFRNRPDRNVVQHPIYDVWVKSCAMTWPETGPDTVKLSTGGDKAAKRSSAEKSPAETEGEPGTDSATAGANSAE